MKSLITLFLSLFLVIGLAAQTSQTGATQPDAKAKPAEKPPVGAKTADPKQPAAGGSPEMPKPSPEIERVLNMLQGRWTTEEKHEPSEFMPQGGTGKGQEAVRPGPGKMSLIAEYSSQGAMGAFSGIGIMSWDATQKAYHLHWIDNMSPTMTVMTGKWEGKDLVFTASEMLMGKKVYTRHAFTNLTPTAFTYTIDMGPAPTQLKRTMTIQYTKVNMEDLRIRRMRGVQ